VHDTNPSARFCRQTHPGRGLGQLTRQGGANLVGGACRCLLVLLDQRHDNESALAGADLAHDERVRTTTGVFG
jgi:hypothetical protein